LQGREALLPIECRDMPCGINELVVAPLLPSPVGMEYREKFCVGQAPKLGGFQPQLADSDIKFPVEV